MKTNKTLLWIILIIVLSNVSYAGIGDNIITYWSMDNVDTNATHITDTSISGFDGVLTGVTTGQPGHLDESYSYAGVDHIEADTNLGISGADTRTINAWIYYTGGTSNYIFCAGESGANSWFALIVDASHELDFSGYANDYSSGTTIIQNSWTMVTAVYNGTHVSTYVNGTETVTSDQAKTLTTTNAPFNTGDRCDLGANNFDGKIDDVVVYNDAKSDAEILELWAAGVGINPLSGGAAQSNTTVNFTATDDFNSSIISNFSINVTWNNGTVQTETTGTGGVYLNLLLNNASLTANVTYYNATDYYNLTLLTQTITANTSTTITVNMYQAFVTMNATEKITDNIMTSTFYTGAISGTIFNLTAGSHNITAETTNYYNQTQEFSIAALTNTTQTVADVYSAEWNISIYNLINGSLVPNYNINVTSLNTTSWVGENSSTSTGSYNFKGINGTYQITIDADDYIVHTFNFTIDDTTGAINFSLYSTNSINFTFFDEESQALLAGYNITVELIGDLMSHNYTTTTGYLYVELLTPQTYMIRYDDTNGTYGERFYYFDLANRTNTAIDLYLLNNGTDGYSAVTATVYDETNHFVEGAIIKALRYYIDTNSYIIVDMGKTNFEGVTLLNLKQNEEFYKFIIEYPMGTARKTTEPTQIYATTLNFQILLGTITGTRWYKSIDTIANVTFDEINYWFRVEWNDPQNTLSQLCLHTNRITQFRNETTNRTCSTASAGIMYHAVNNITGYTYHSQALAYYSDPPAPIAAAYHTFTATNPIGAIGLFVLVLITICFVFIGRWNLAVAVVLTPLPTMLASVGGLIAIPGYITVPVEIVAMIIAYIISTRA